MKCLPGSRNVVVFALALLLAAASAPAALALPAGPAGAAGPAWDVEAFFGWVQGLLGGLLGGGAGEEVGPSQVTERQRAISEPDGIAVTSNSTGLPSSDEDSELRGES